MSEYSKKIQMDEYKGVQYEIKPGLISLHVITSFDINPPIDTIKFTRWDDYCFFSWVDQEYEEYEKSKKQSHTFEKDHPLYGPLLHLLRGDDELIIDDDDTNELNKKYMRIYLEGENINIDFINELENDTSNDRFRVFIKNITFDLRSKIDSFKKDTKDRLHDFFSEVYALVKEDNNQITNNIETQDKPKKYIKQ